MARIFLSPPHLAGSERELIDEALSSNWIAPLGPDVDAFERELAETAGARAAAALNSGTAALHLALLLLGVGEGDDVLCSTFTFAASAFAIRYVGARPVFVDCSPDTWNADPELVERAITERAGRGKVPSAAIIVDLYGQSADWNPIQEVCGRYGMAIVEDAAEALGARYGGRPAGGFGRCGVFSFNGNKMITTSGGGMLVSDDEALISRARFLASQAREPVSHYQHEVIGYNYRMSNLLAAVGRAQLRVLDDRVASRRRVFRGYEERLGDLPGLQFMPEASYGRATRWLTCITIDPGAAGTDRESVRLALEAEDIESRPLWKPMHLQPVFANCDTVGGGVSASLFERGLCLPSGSALSDGELDRIASVVRACFSSV